MDGEVGSTQIGNHEKEKEMFQMLRIYDLTPTRTEIPLEHTRNAKLGMECGCAPTLQHYWEGESGWSDASFKVNFDTEGRVVCASLYIGGEVRLHSERRGKRVAVAFNRYPDPESNGVSTSTCSPNVLQIEDAPNATGLCSIFNSNSVREDGEVSEVVELYSGRCCGSASEASFDHQSKGGKKPHAMIWSTDQGYRSGGYVNEVEFGEVFSEARE
ncbi:hypothetical protein C8R45DRAFT_927758 [Mycena sanguinolenta]|nr:hypothetical protein C8R45DRAFT_927758 [Mycena sanguinolenta]